MTRASNSIKKHITLLRALRDGKQIRTLKLFAAEGAKTIHSLLISGMRPHLLLRTDAFGPQHDARCAQICLVTSHDMVRLSAMKSPPEAIAIFPLPAIDPLPLSGRRSLLLDCVQDPTNVGTIVRTAHWFGLDQVLCSHDCALIYRPKGIQASMGSISGIHVAYGDLNEHIHLAGKGFTTLAMTLQGAPPKGDPPNSCAILLGNEGHGVRKELLTLCTGQITLPPARETAVDSLNVSACGAIVCAWLSGMHSAV